MKYCITETNSRVYPTALRLNLKFKHSNPMQKHISFAKISSQKKRFFRTLTRPRKRPNPRSRTASLFDFGFGNKSSTKDLSDLDLFKTATDSIKENIKLNAPRTANSLANGLNASFLSSFRGAKRKKSPVSNWFSAFRNGKPMRRQDLEVSREKSGLRSQRSRFESRSPDVGKRAFLTIDKGE